MKVKVSVPQLCLILCDPMDLRGLPGSSFHGISQAKILEWVTIPFSGGSSQPRDQTQISCIAGSFFTTWTTGDTHSLKAREVPFYSWKYTIPTKILGACPFSDSCETIVLIYTNIVLNLYIVIASVLWYLHLICCSFLWLMVIFLWIKTDK